MSIIGIYLFVNLFNVNFPEDRVVLYLFPLVIGSMFFVFDSFKGRRSQYLYLTMIPLLFFPIHFISSINTSYVNGYYTEALPNRYYQTISAEHERSSVIPTIGGSNMRQFSWAYMNYMNGGHENSIDWRGYPDTVSMFQILEKSKYPYDLSGYDSIDHESYSGLTLFKRKQEVLKAKIKEINYSEPQYIKDSEYFNLLEVDVDTLANKGHYFKFSMSIVTEDTPITCWLVLQVLNNEKSTILYKYFPFNWLRHGFPNTLNNYSQSFYLEKLPEESDIIKIYIWNLDKKTYTLNSAKVEMSELL